MKATAASGDNGASSSEEEEMEAGQRGRDNSSKIQFAVVFWVTVSSTTIWSNVGQNLGCELDHRQDNNEGLKPDLCLF